MYIRRTTIKSRASGEPYTSHRLVESIRTDNGVRQRTIINLGRHFEVPREQWPALAQRIEHIISGQGDLVPPDLDPQWEAMAQRYSAQVIRARARHEDTLSGAPDYHTVDVSSLDVLRPRSVGVEHVSLAALRQVGLEQLLEGLGFTRPQRSAALGSIIARMTVPGSELFTHGWLQQQSAVGELIEYDFEGMSLMRLYRASDQLLKHKETLERTLYERERSRFVFEEVITL
jgi:hypothetical protein